MRKETEIEEMKQRLIEKVQLEDKLVHITNLLVYAHNQRAAEAYNMLQYLNKRKSPCETCTKKTQESCAIIDNRAMVHYVKVNRGFFYCLIK